MNEEPQTASVGRLVVRICVGAVTALLIAMAGCQSGPPVQEMSDARQAIAVAREAGAEEHAADELRLAEEHLDNAEARLTEKAYAQARREALQAKRSALDALTIADRPAYTDQP